MNVLLPYLSNADKVDRPVSTAIYFLLPSGSVSKLHRIPCAETWHFYLGESITVNARYLQITLLLVTLFDASDSLNSF